MHLLLIIITAAEFIQKQHCKRKSSM